MWIAAQDQISGIIECCTGEPVSLGEQAERFIRSHDLQITLDYGQFPEPKGESPGVWGDPTRIRQIRDIVLR